MLQFVCITIKHLIPIKTLDFHSSVNLTIGLSFIRTSPDHGTAFDIAGKNLANPTSTIEAIKLAWHLSKRNKEINKLQPIRQVIEKYDLNAKKSLGQNFIFDLNLTSKIARLAGDLTNFEILEIGAGPGGLTRGLLSEGAKSCSN